MDLIPALNMNKGAIFRNFQTTASSIELSNTTYDDVVATKNDTNQIQKGRGMKF